MEGESNLFLRDWIAEVQAASEPSFVGRHLAINLAKDVFNLKSTNNKVIFIGNGASNTIANHAALDYMGQTGVTTMSVNDPAVLTAFANDFGYEKVFERFVKINFNEGDILVAVSSSGNSPNVVNAVKYVNSIGGKTYCLSGFDKDNELSQICENNLWVNNKKYNIVESVHNLWLAMVCDLLIDWMGNKVGIHGIEV